MAENNKPWLTPEGRAIWKTEAQYWTWLRGSLRRLWTDYPLRKEWKNRQLRPVTQEERKTKTFHSSTKKVGQCVYCEKWFPGSKLQCDHKLASQGCTSRETAESFLWHCGGGVGTEWVLSCEPCHKIKSYGEEHGLSFEVAKATKKAIATENAKAVSRVLEDNGIVPASNQPKRRKQLVELYLNASQ